LNNDSGEDSGMHYHNKKRIKKQRVENKKQKAKRSSVLRLLPLAFFYAKTIPRIV
jgi:hypothetical protein